MQKHLFLRDLRETTSLNPMNLLFRAIYSLNDVPGI